jgi:hypothetical protein
MLSRRELARRLDGLLTGTDSSGSAGLDERWAVLADAPLVRRIREALVDDSTVMPAATLEHVTAFLSSAELSIAARVVAGIVEIPLGDQERPRSGQPDRVIRLATSSGKPMVGRDEPSAAREGR